MTIHIQVIKKSQNYDVKNNHKMVSFLGVYTEHSQPNPIVVNSGIMPTVLSGVKQQTTTVEQLNTWMTVLPEVHESTAPPDTASPLTEVLGVEATTTKRQDIQNNSLPIPLGG